MLSGTAGLAVTTLYRKYGGPKAVPRKDLSAAGFPDVTVVAPYLALNYNFAREDDVHEFLLNMPAFLLSHSVRYIISK